MASCGEMLRCSKPLYHEHSDEDFSYTFAGSIFAVSFRERLLLVTARHVFDNGQPEAARIWLNGRSLALTNVLLPNEREESYGDLAILEADIMKLDAEDRADLSPIILDSQVSYSLSTLPRNVRLVVKGYPSEVFLPGTITPKCQLNHDEKKLTPTGYCTDAAYGGPIETGVHLVHYYPGARPVRSHDGMSGSPWIVDDPNAKEWQHKLAGAHRSEGDLKVGRFVGSDVLVGMLRTHFCD